MKIIGITGPTGAGKTTALLELEKLGAYVIDCDALYHELLESSENLRSDIERRFPQTVKDGKLDRKKLGACVFGDKSAMEDLNMITNAYIKQEINRIIKKKTEEKVQIIAIDAIRLIESGLSSMCDMTVSIIAPYDIRAKRIMAREKISFDYAMLRIKAQPSDEFFEKNSDYILLNDCDSIEEFKRKSSEFFRKILSE